MKTSKKLAIFDIDGTVFRGCFLVELMKTLIHFGIFPREAEKKVDHDYFAWVERRAPYQTYIEKATDLFLEMIKGCKEEDIRKYSMRVASYFRNRNYVFTKRLIEKLRPTHFLLSISGSPQEIVEEYNKYLNFDKVYGSVYGLDLKTRIYTGEMTLGASVEKEKIFNKFVKENNFSLKDSVGVGDTEFDVSFLKQVEKPIAFNPNATLLKIAREKGWEIVTERKDVIYHLGKDTKFDSYY